MIATRTFAAQFMCSSLVDACNKYMNKHFVEVSNSPDYLDLAVADVLDLLGRDELHVENEEQVRRFFRFLSCPASLLRTFSVAFSFLRPPVSFPMPSSMSLPVHQCRSYHCSVHFPLDLHVHSPVAQHSRHSRPVLPPALHSVGDFRMQFSILR